MNGKNFKWNEIVWSEIELKVFNLQVQIYKQSKLGNVKACQDLQRELVKSLEAKPFYAVWFNWTTSRFRRW